MLMIQLHIDIIINADAAVMSRRSERPGFGSLTAWRRAPNHWLCACEVFPKSIKACSYFSSFISVGCRLIRLCQRWLSLAA